MAGLEHGDVKMTSQEYNKLLKELKEKEQKMLDFSKNLNNSCDNIEDGSGIINSASIQLLDILKSQINGLKIKINSARIVIPKSTDKIRFGSYVKVLFDGNLFQTTLSGVFDSKENTIAVGSPFAKAIIGKGKGDKTFLEIGSVKKTIEILEVK